MPHEMISTYITGKYRIPARAPDNPVFETKYVLEIRHEVFDGVVRVPLLVTYRKHGDRIEAIQALPILPSHRALYDRVKLDYISREFTIQYQLNGAL